MNELKRNILSIASRMLCYPDETIDQDLQTIRNWAVQQQDEPLRHALMKVVDSFRSVDLTQLQRIYVATFDLKEATGLYMTAHELGDSRKRGNALILLQSTINEAGFEWSGDELADYIPMLYEFLAEGPAEDKSYHKLVDRLAVVTQRILDHVPNTHLYHGILTLLMEHVFEIPSQKAIKRLEAQQEEADLGQMPYPIQFQ